MIAQHKNQKKPQHQPNPTAKPKHPQRKNNPKKRRIHLKEHVETTELIQAALHETRISSAKKKTDSTGNTFTTSHVNDSVAPQIPGTDHPPTEHRAVKNLLL